MSANYYTNDRFLYTNDRKRKLDFTSDDIIWQNFTLPQKKKKKKKKSKKKKEPTSRGNNLAHGHNLYYNDSIHVNNWSNFAMVNARPENLAPTPPIFNHGNNTNQNRLPQIQDTSNLFYLNSISDKCFSSDIRNRFINFIKAGDGNNDKQTTVGNDSIKKNKNKSQQNDSALQKARQKQAAIAHRDKSGKKEIEKGLKSIQQGSRNEGNQIKEEHPRIEHNQRKEQKPRIEQNQRKEQEPRIEQNLRKEQKPRIEQNQRKEQEPRIEHNQRKEQKPRIEQNQRKEQEPRIEHNQRKEQEPRIEQNQRKEVYPIDKDFQMGMVPEDRFYKVDMYETHLKEAVVFHMHYSSEFTFHGEIKITVIAGQIEILGYVLKKSTRRTVDVYSPNFYTPWIVECKHLKRNYNKEKVRSKIEHLLNPNDVDKLLNNLKFNGAILLIEQIKSTFGGVIGFYFDKSLFCKDLVDFSSNSESLKSLQSTFNFKVTDEGIRKNPQWDGIPLDHCLVLCGGNRVGKSTLLRYFVNKALMQKEKVLCLDFDPGQPEFTPPGCLSAVVVDKPLLGPNFSHLTDPEIMVYFGSVDVAHNPTLYLECVNYIIEKCMEKEELSNMTWFVNTMGFNRGIGVELMTAIIKLLKPNVVVQIRSTNMKNNYPCYFTPRHVNGKNSNWSVLKENVELSYDLRVVDSLAQIGKKLQGGLTPKHLREILFYSYFGKMVSPPDYSFNAVKPYLRSFSNLYLGIESLISPSEILKAFNGSLVSLSHFERGSEEIFVTESETDDYFKIVLKPAIWPSLGLGLVRGINVEERKFYVLTPLSDEKLDEVNCLSLGRILTPFSMFLTQEDVKGQLPYTCVSTIDSIQKVNRLFPQPVSAQGNDK